MTLFQGIASLFGVVALCCFLNIKWLLKNKTLNLSANAGMTAAGLVLSAFVTAIGVTNPEMTSAAKDLMKRVNFTEVVFHGMLPLVLFASAYFGDISKMATYKISIFLLATVGVFISMFAVGIGVYGLLWAVNASMPMLGLAFHIEISFIMCLLLGAILSPTDPIAVISALKQAAVSIQLETKILGESLLNDATAVVAFMTVLGLAAGTTDPSFGTVAYSLGKEVIGSLILGALMGLGVAWMMRQMAGAHVEIIVVSFAAALGSYALAELIHVSAPMTVVVLGLVVGATGRKYMDETSSKHMDVVWETVDQVLNQLLFCLIGLEVIALTLNWNGFWLGLLVIPIVLAARWVSVFVPFLALNRFRNDTEPNTVSILTWGGLRGGISIALVLSLPVGMPGRELLIQLTYVTVLFSLLVQATTLPGGIKWLKARSSPRNSQTIPEPTAPEPTA